MNYIQCPNKPKRTDFIVHNNPHVGAVFTFIIFRNLAQIHILQLSSIDLASTGMFWILLHDRRHLRMLSAINISENTQFAKFAKYNGTPKFVDFQ